MDSRRIMVFSVSALGICISAVLIAYLVYADMIDEDMKTIRQVNIIFRHGAKYPERSFRRDLHQNDIENIDLGALTNAGSVQSYNLGVNLRHRYLKLFPKNGFWSRKSISVKSSWADRVIMSAQSFLAGFMPPLDNLNPLPIPWQPVPVYTLHRSTDDLIVQRRPCARYDKVFFEALQSYEVKKMNEESQQLYHHLSIGTGENISSLHAVELLHDTLQAEKAAGWELPEWTEGFFPSKTLPIAEFYVRLLTKTPFMKKIKAGPLVTEIIENMSANKNRMESEKAINIYAAHDITLINLMNSMGFLDQTANKPEFSAALAIELHESYSGTDLEVKIFYYFNSEDKYPKSIKIEGCDGTCTLTQFQKVMNHLIVNDYEKLCEVV